MLVYYADKPPVAMRGLCAEVEERGEVAVMSTKNTPTGGYEIAFSNGAVVKVLPMYFPPRGFAFN